MSVATAFTRRVRYITCSYYSDSYHNVLSLKRKSIHYNKSNQLISLNSVGYSIAYRRITTFSTSYKFLTRNTFSKLKQTGIYPTCQIMSDSGTPTKTDSEVPMPMDSEVPKSTEPEVPTAKDSEVPTKTSDSKPISKEDAIKAAKEKYLNLELDEKRDLYQCGDKYVVLKDVLNWEEYFSKEELEKIKIENGKYEKRSELNSKVSLWQGDITALEIDAIVNAANSSLLGGGGVDGAIHRAAGRNLLRECRELHGCEEGEAKITGGYRLPSKHVIHTVGPQEEEAEILRECYVNSLRLMLENQLRTIAFPCIGTGIYGFPRIHAAHIALKTARKMLEQNPEKVDRVIFTVFLDQDKEVYQKLMQLYFPL